MRGRTLMIWAGAYVAIPLLVMLCAAIVQVWLIAPWWFAAGITWAISVLIGVGVLAMRLASTMEPPQPPAMPPPPWRD